MEVEDPFDKKRAPMGKVQELIDPSYGFLIQANRQTISV